MPLIPLSVLADLHQVQLGVVPVVAQAGTALFPLIVLAITSVIGLLLKPRELLRVFRQKPWIPALLVAVGLGGWWSFTWLTSAPSAPTTRIHASSSAPTNGPRTDWAKVALVLIEQEAVAQKKPTEVTSAAPVATSPALTPSPGNSAPAVTTNATDTPVARYFRGDPRRSGHLGGTAPRGLTNAWTYVIADKEKFIEQETMYLSSPLVVGDALFGASCFLDAPNSYGKIFRLDAKTGKQRWLCELKNPKGGEFKGFFSSPAITADGRCLVIGQGLHTDYDSELVCLDAATGAVRWLLPTPLHIESSPCIEGDLVVAGAGAVEQGKDHRPVGDALGKGHPGFVVGVRISDGIEIFRAPVIDPEGSPVLVDGICYVGSGINGSAVVALRTQSDAELKTADLKRELWRTATPFPASGAVTLSGDLLLVGCGNGDFVFAAEHPEGRVIALDKTTGAIRWQANMPDAVLGTIAVVGTTAIVPIRNGEVAALDLAAAGKERWRVRISTKAAVLAGPAFTGELVYAVTNDGYLVVLDARDGKQAEKVYINGKNRGSEMGLSTSSPLVVDGRLYIGSENGGLRCFVGSAP